MLFIEKIINKGTFTDNKKYFHEIPSFKNITSYLNKKQLYFSFSSVTVSPNVWNLVLHISSIRKDIKVKSIVQKIMEGALNNYFSPWETGYFFSIDFSNDENALCYVLIMTININTKGILDFSIIQPYEFN